MSFKMVQSQDKPKAVVLLSGGLDSAVALAEALLNYHVVRVLVVDYGQRAFEPEVKASRGFIDYYDLSCEVVSLPWLKALLPKSLLRDDLEAQKREDEVRDVDSVWVPNRNGVLLNMAAAFAEAQGADVVIYGANEEEGRRFPDNTPAYRERLNDCFALSTLNQVRVETPVGHLNKREIMERGLELGVPLSLIWSCYGSGPIHCGECPSCLLLRKALKEAKGVVGDQSPDIRFKSEISSF